MAHSIFPGWEVLLSGCQVGTAGQSPGCVCRTPAWHPGQCSASLSPLSITFLTFSFLGGGGGDTQRNTKWEAFLGGRRQRTAVRNYTNSVKTKVKMLTNITTITIIWEAQNFKKGDQRSSGLTSSFAHKQRSRKRLRSFLLSHSFLGEMAECKREVPC